MEVLSFKKYGVKLKATIQATGKLGFPKGTSDALDFANRRYVKFFKGDDGVDDLYLARYSEPNEDAFKINISSGYYSVNTSTLFDILNINYRDNTIIFDLIRVANLDDELSGEVYKMSKRIISKNEDDMES